jgi:hypothetical protein
MKWLVILGAVLVPLATVYPCEGEDSLGGRSGDSMFNYLECGLA